LPRAFVLLAGLLAVPGSPAHANYRAKAIELTDAIQHAFYDDQNGIYRSNSPRKLTGGLDYEVMWGNGVQFSALNGAEKTDPEKYKPILYAFAKGLTKYWDTGVKPPGFDAYFSSPKDDDKYYDDNAWLVLGFTEAYRNTKDPAFLDWARQVQNFVYSGWDDKLGGGIYWYQNKKDSKNTCVNAPAIVGALALYQISGEKSDLDSAIKIYDWTMSHLQDKDGLFLDNINLEGKITDWKFTYNTGLMIRANLDLWKVTKDEKYFIEARREADASLVKWADPQTGAFGDSARFSHLLAEALLQCYDATKDIKYLNAVRRHADFGYRYVRDVRSGLYFSRWDSVNRSERNGKELIENAAAARLFWLLVPYQDVEELQANAENAEKQGDHAAAVTWYQQVQASTAGAANTQPVLPPKP
jgi:uncharacterized protein YyaL (SSP411 family)